MPRTTFGEDDGLDKARSLARSEERSAKENEAAQDEIQKVRHTLKIQGKSKGVPGKQEQAARHHLRKRRGVMAALGLGGIGVVLGITLLSPSLLLVNMKEQLVNDLNDSTLAYYTYARKVLAQQVGGGSCAEKTIRCKFNTMSDMLKKRFEERGFGVQATRNTSNDRHSVSLIKTPDGRTALDSTGLMQLMREDTASADQIYNVTDPKNALFHDRKFVYRLYKKFHILHKQILGGRTMDEVKESFDQNLWSDDDFLDNYGRGVFGIDYLQQTGDVWREKIYPEIVSKAKTHLAITCGMHTYASLLEGSVQQAKATTLARFAMQYLTTADIIKAGQKATDQEVEFLSDRLSIAGVGDKTAMDGSSFRVPAMYEVPKSAGQPFNRTYMNDNKVALTIFSALGGIFGAPGTTYLKNSSMSIDSTPSGREACIRGVSSAQETSERSGQCLRPGIQSLAQYIGPISFAAVQVPQVVQAIRVACAVSVQAVVEMAKALTAPEASLTTSMLLEPVLRQEYRRFGSQTYGIAAQDAVFAGTGILLGDVAQSIGMRPASRASLQNYLAATADTYRDLVRSERLLARNTPWDIMNKYSFAGTVLQNIGGMSLLRQTTSLGAGVTFMSTLLPRAAAGFASPIASAFYSQPANQHWERLISAADCQIPGGLDINPDFGCNIRYSMSKNDLNKDINAVVAYMTASRSDSAGDAPTFDTGADTEVGQKMQQAHSEGASTSYVDPVTGEPNKYTEYAKFIEYCTNRTLPWGVVGMKTEYVPDDYSPDDDMGPFGVRTYSHPDYESTPVNTDDETELPWAYYGLTWGSDGDQDWMTGKKCLEESEMLNNFRAYTTMCRALAGMSGARECWHEDATPDFTSGFHSRNNIIFIRE